MSGSTTGLTTSEPTINQNSTKNCGVKPDRLFWNVQSEDVAITAGQEKTLTFQATGTLPAGTYYNQASVRYVPWWDSNSVDVFTPLTAEITVVSGTPYCGYDLNVRVTKDVQPATTTPGVETEFTYTVSTENLSSGLRYVCKIEDELPPTFTYVTGSSGEYVNNIDTSEPTLDWDNVSGRWTLDWSNGQGGNLPPLDSLNAGETKTQVFRAIATPEQGVSYSNEINAVWSKQLVGGHCKTGGGSGGSSTFGGTIEGGSSGVEGIRVYDITSFAPDGTVQSRVQFTETDGSIQILSWQLY